MVMINVSAEVLQKNMIDIGLGGWMADFGEYVSPDAKFTSGNAGDMVHNKWPVLWAQLNREAVEERGKLGEVVFFMRAGGAGELHFKLSRNAPYRVNILPLKYFLVPLLPYGI